MQVILDLKKDWYPKKLVSKYSQINSTHTVVISDISPTDINNWTKIPNTSLHLYLEHYDIHHNRNHGLIYIKNLPKHTHVNNKSVPTRNCHTCKFNGDSMCHFNPPTILGFPKIEPQWWCNQHLLKTQTTLP